MESSPVRKPESENDRRPSPGERNKDESETSQAEAQLTGAEKRYKEIGRKALSKTPSPPPGERDGERGMGKTLSRDRRVAS